MKGILTLYCIVVPQLCLDQQDISNRATRSSIRSGKDTFGEVVVWKMCESNVLTLKVVLRTKMEGVEKGIIYDPFCFMLTLCF